MSDEGDAMAHESLRQTLLRAVFERVLRAADYPGAWEGPVGKRVAAEVEADGAIVAGLDRLDAEAAAVFGNGFVELHLLQQDELVDRMEGEQGRTRWEEPTAAEWLSAIVNVIGRAYSENREGNPPDGLKGQM